MEVPRRSGRGSTCLRMGLRIGVSAWLPQDGAVARAGHPGDEPARAPRHRRSVPAAEGPPSVPRLPFLHHGRQIGGRRHPCGAGAPVRAARSDASRSAIAPPT